jgi:hypothetical protein
MIQSKYIKTDLGIEFYDEMRGVEAFIPIKHSNYTHYLVAYRHNKEFKRYTLGLFPCVKEDDVIRYAPTDGFRVKIKDADRITKSELKAFKDTIHSNVDLQVMINELENQFRMKGE